MKSMLALLALISISAFSAVESGSPAPDFTLQGLNKEVKLSDYKGKVVVLEWTNHGCPFVAKHYDSGNMQALQKKYTEKGTVWLSIISSAEGKQGYVDQKGAAQDKATYKSNATDILLDPTGKVGQLYGAKTTPHMFIIDKDGTVAYQGAIDNKNDHDKNSVKDAENYVARGLDELMFGKKISRPTTQSYGCSVKY